MTRNRGFKRLIRERTKRTSESYSTARADLRRRGEQADAQLVTRSRPNREEGRCPRPHPSASLGSASLKPTSSGSRCSGLRKRRER